MIEPFPDRYRRALANAALRTTLLEFQRTWRATRDRQVEQIDFDTLRSRLMAVKDEVIDHLPRYVDQFSGAAQRAGATVFHAASADDAVRYVTDLAVDRRVRTIVKAKSMLSEEIELNRGLETAGMRVIETDLGEWIVQLAGERPSHIIAPAVHKNRRQVSELLERVTERPVSRDNIAEQVAVAREALRQEFLAGDMGISGANALIAENGAVMLVTNEGNAELVTCLPRVQVVLAGVEKLLPTLDDAVAQLEILAPSATGQIASSYVSFIAGPTGPDHELHIVLVDNGRTSMRASPIFRDALRCIRCGACSGVCPSYGVVGGHVFGHIYTGPIGLVNTPFHHHLDADAGPQSLCVSCNACEAVCPVGIPLPRQILSVRAEVAEATGLPALQRLGLAAWSQPSIAQLATRAASYAQVPIRRGAFVEPPGLGSFTSWRKLPAISGKPFRDRWDGLPRRRLPAPLGGRLKGLTITYFVQCLTDWLYPEIGVAIVEVLRGLGATVRFPRRQHCCGLPAIDSGSPGTARRMARQTIRTLEACHADYIVSGGTSCMVAMSHDYPHLFPDEPEWQRRAAGLGSRMLDFTSFMHRVADLPDHSLGGAVYVATYHYFCQSYNVLGFRDEPLHLLRAVCDLDLKDLPEGQVCCGFGGSVSLKRPEVCEQILRRKLENVDATRAPLLITDNPGCIMHLRGGAAASGRSLAVKHTAEIVAERLRALHLSAQR